jgi:hypothetical protein
MVTWDAHEEGRGIHFSLEWLKWLKPYREKGEENLGYFFPITNVMSPGPTTSLPSVLKLLALRFTQFL